MITFNTQQQTAVDQVLKVILTSARLNRLFVAHGTAMVQAQLRVATAVVYHLVLLKMAVICSLNGAGHLVIPHLTIKLLIVQLPM